MGMLNLHMLKDQLKNVYEKALGPKSVYKSGDILRRKDSMRPYILATVDCDRVNLICLHDGNRWSDTMDVEDVMAVRSDEYPDIEEYFDQVPNCSLQIIEKK
jgi:hypothetical protein